MVEKFIDPLNMLESNKDWNDFTTVISDNTGDHYMKLWEENSSANRSLIRKCGWATSEFQDAYEGKTAVMLGASPHVLTQIDTIKSLQNDPEFVLIGISSGIKMFLEHGIRPKYVMIADADPAIKRFWEGMDMEQTSGITLIANVCTHPDLLEMWKGDIKFLCVHTDNGRLERKLRKKHEPLNGCGALFPSLGSQYNIGAAFAYLVFGCRVIIFVGNELSFATENAATSKYYADREDIKDTWLRKPHPDIYGNTVYTNYMFMSLKLMLEDFLGKISGDGYFLNATEKGIFGVSARYANIPWVFQLRLPMAIAQARHIMRTGDYMRDGFAIKPPSLEETLKYSIGGH